jgi:hypothetical protein
VIALYRERAIMVSKKYQLRFGSPIFDFFLKNLIDLEFL